MMKYDNGATHGTGYPTKVLAERGGAHIFNVKVTKDIDNGRFVARGTWTAGDYYAQAEAVKAFAGEIVGTAVDGKYLIEVQGDTDALLVYSTPYSNVEEKWKEPYMYNEKDSIARCYQLKDGDIVAVSKENITGTIAANAKITSINADGQAVIV